MIKIHVENVKATLANVLTQMNLAIIAGKEVEIKPGVFLKLEGPLDFTVKNNPNGIEVVFKLRPKVRVNKFFNFYGDLTGVLVRKDGVELHIDGLPDVFLEAIS